MSALSPSGKSSLTFWQSLGQKSFAYWLIFPALLVILGLNLYPTIQGEGAMTGVPMVLNTSFNENEPVVCRPNEALDCFLRTKMDLLVLGNQVVRRH